MGRGFADLQGNIKTTTRHRQILHGRSHGARQRFRRFRTRLGQLGREGVIRISQFLLLRAHGIDIACIR